MNGEILLTLPLNPKKTRGFLPHTEPLPFEKPGVGVDLTFIILIPGDFRCGRPLGELNKLLSGFRRTKFEST